MISDNVTQAIRQLRKGETIGRRGTPVISFWDMKPKWEKWGNAWQYYGSDGSPFVEQGNFVCPSVLRLVYFRTHNGRVCQLAYVVKEEAMGPIGSMQVESALRNFESLTKQYPEKIY